MIEAIGPSQDHSFDDGISGPDLTAMLDVIFLLLVFSVLTAHSVEHALELDLPEKGADQATAVTDQNTITLTLFADEKRWAVEGHVLDRWENVEKTMIEIRNERSDVEVIIAGDRRVAMERLLQALAFLQRQGVETAEILMQPGSARLQHKSSNDAG